MTKNPAHLEPPHTDTMSLVVWICGAGITVGKSRYGGQMYNAISDAPLKPLCGGGGVRRKKEVSGTHSITVNIVWNKKQTIGSRSEATGVMKRHDS